MKSKLVYPRLSYKIIGILYGVFNDLGYGYKEKYYQKAIAIELEKENIKFDQEKKIKLQYKDREIGKYFIDFVIENKVVLEIKVSRQFHLRDFRQIYSYLIKTKLKLGILAIFTPKGVYYRRILNIGNNL